MSKGEDEMSADYEASEQAERLARRMFLVTYGRMLNMMWTQPKMESAYMNGEDISTRVDNYSGNIHFSTQHRTTDGTKWTVRQEIEIKWVLMENDEQGV